VTLEHSRPIKLAESVSGRKRQNLESHLDAATVVVSVDSDVPQAHLTARVLLSTLRRGPGVVMLVADGLPSAFVTEMEEVTTAIDTDRGLRVIRESAGIPDTAVSVHIGPTSWRRAIRILPEGHGAHVASATTAVIRPRRPGTPLGAVYTAALGTGEVFKHTVEVIPNRRVLHRHLTFCPVSLSSDLSAAPDLADLMTLDLTLVGVGAIGTGIALLLDALGAEGRIVVVDPQRFARENRGTYSLGGVAEVDAAPWKVEMARSALPRFDVIPFHEPVDELIRAIDREELPWTPLVLTALDSPEARRDAQRLWPDRLIDAATGDTMLGLHDDRHGVDPCMVCIFPVNTHAPSGADIVAKRLGLSVDVLADADAILTEEHLVGKTDEQQALLRPHLGTTMCGLARATDLTHLGADDYMPSVPFVSLQAACLSIGRLIASHAGEVPATNLVQYDSLFGPQAATLELMRPRPDCICTARSSAIEEVRRRRATSGAKVLPDKG
jgi:hypothetical protein